MLVARCPAPSASTALLRFCQTQDTSLLAWWLSHTGWCRGRPPAAGSGGFPSCSPSGHLPQPVLLITDRTACTSISSTSQAMRYASGHNSSYSYGNGSSSSSSSFRDICRHFSRTGTCKFGDSCRYIHQAPHQQSRNSQASALHTQSAQGGYGAGPSRVHEANEQSRATPDEVLPRFTEREWTEKAGPAAQAAAPEAVAAHSSAGPGAPQASAVPFPFRLMSYNLLSDELAHHHYGELYAGTPKRHLDWEGHRWPLTLAEIKHWQPDMLALQEVDQYNFWRIQADLEAMGYQGCYAQRTGNRGDGCATFWNASRLHSVATEWVNMRDHGLKDNVALLVALAPGPHPAPGLTGAPGQVPGGLGASEPAGPEDGGDGDAHATDCMAAVAQSTSHAPAGGVVVLGNTHVLFNNKRGDIKLGQIRTALTKMRDLAAKLSSSHGHLTPAAAGNPANGSQPAQLPPVCILCGDFNTAPGSGVYRFLCDGSLHLPAHDRRNMSGQNEGWGFKHYQRDLRAGRPCLQGFCPPQPSQPHSPHAPHGSSPGSSQEQPSSSNQGAQDVQPHASASQPAEAAGPDAEAGTSAARQQAASLAAQDMEGVIELQGGALDHSGGGLDGVRARKRQATSSSHTDGGGHDSGEQAAAMQALAQGGVEAMCITTTTTTTLTVQAGVVSKVDQYLGPYPAAVYEPWQGATDTQAAVAQPLLPQDVQATPMETSTAGAAAAAPAAAEPLIPPHSGTSSQPSETAAAPGFVVNATTVTTTQTVQAVQAASPAAAEVWQQGMQTYSRTYGYFSGSRRGQFVQWEEEELDAAMGREAAQQLLNGLSLGQFHGRPRDRETAYRRELAAARKQQRQQGLLVARHPLQLRSAYVDAAGREPSFTTCHLRCMDTVDYVWFTPEGVPPSHHSHHHSHHDGHHAPSTRDAPGQPSSGSSTPGAPASHHQHAGSAPDDDAAASGGAGSSSTGRPGREVLRVRRVLQAPDSTRFVVGMPNAHWASDHICLVVDFELG